MSQILHVFHDVHMGKQHAGLMAILKEKVGEDSLPKGQFALFLNSKWSAVKVYGPGSTILYRRELQHGYLTLDDIRRIPTMVGGPMFKFTGNHEERLMRLFEKQFGKPMKRVRAVAE